MQRDIPFRLVDYILVSAAHIAAIHYLHLDRHDVPHTEASLLRIAPFCLHNPHVTHGMTRRRIWSVETNSTDAGSSGKSARSSETPVILGTERARSHVASRILSYKICFSASLEVGLRMVVSAVPYTVRLAALPKHLANIIHRMDRAIRRRFCV